MMRIGARAGRGGSERVGAYPLGDATGRADGPPRRGGPQASQMKPLRHNDRGRSSYRPHNPQRGRAARRTAAVAFAVTFLAVPVALLTGVRPGPLAAMLGALSAAVWVATLRFDARMRAGARDAVYGLLTAAAILGALHASQLLEPMYRREGWLELPLRVSIEPAVVAPGDKLTYTLSTVNDGVRPALGRRFLVDGNAVIGFVMYGVLPELHGIPFSVATSPHAERIAPDGEPAEAGSDLVSVVYADLELPELNPSSWDWSTRYTPGGEVVGVILGDRATAGSLDVGETLRLTYRVIVPQGHPEGVVDRTRGSLSYRDPQWSTYYVHDLRFRFDQPVVVRRP